MVISDRICTRTSVIGIGVDIPCNSMNNYSYRTLRETQAFVLPRPRFEFLETSSVSRSQKLSRPVIGNTPVHLKINALRP